MLFPHHVINNATEVSQATGSEIETKSVCIMHLWYRLLVHSVINNKNKWSKIQIFLSVFQIQADSAIKIIKLFCNIIK